MHGFVHAQTLGIGPVEHARTHKRHGRFVSQRHKLDVFRAAQRLDALDQLGQRIAHPWNHHGPALDTAQAVDALFLGAELEQILNAVLSGFFDQTFDLHRPGRGLERVGVAYRVGFIGAELVEIVVAAGVLVAGQLFHGDRSGHRRLATRKRRQLAGARIDGQGFAPGPCRQRCTGSTAGQKSQHVAPVFIDRTRRDLGRQRVCETRLAGQFGHERLRYIVESYSG